MPTTRTRDTWPDLLRIAAAFFVVLIHVSSGAGAAGRAYGALARFSVPLFVMISGYYLLPDGKPMLRRTLKTLALLLVWGGIYFAYDLLSGAEYRGLSAALTQILTEPVHLWYLYATAALYIFTPIFRVFYRHADPKTYAYALALCFVFGSVVTLALRLDLPLLASIVDKSKLATALGFPFLFLLGGFFRRFPKHAKKALRFLYPAGILTAIAAVALAVFLPEPQVLDTINSFFSPNALLSAAALFTLFWQHPAKFEPRSPKLRTFIREFSACTLGVYLVHPLLLMLTWDALGPLTLLGPAADLPLKSLAIFAASTLLVFIYRFLLHKICKLFAAK